MSSTDDETCYWNGWGWFFIIFIFFFFFLLLLIPWGYSRSSATTVEYLPAERYRYQPSRVIEVESD